MTEYEWTCAGCGIPSPNKERRCDCATNVVVWDRKHEWKRDTERDNAIAAAKILLESEGYSLSQADQS